MTTYDARIEKLFRKHRSVRVIGIDDAPFVRGEGRVNFSGCVCAGTRFEGMVWGELTEDGWDSTDAICAKLEGSKFLPQVHVILLDGLALGGFNVVDIVALGQRLNKPVVAVTRKMPDLDAVRRAMKKLPDFPKRWALIERAGAIHEFDQWCFQVSGLSPRLCHQVMLSVTDVGFVPEALRVAHLIGGAVKLGESGRRA